MTPHLHVQVRLHNAVIEDRLLVVRHRVWLGECDGAAVAFLGAILDVRSTDGDLWLRGEPLPLDEPLVQRWGEVEVRLAATMPVRLPRDWTWVPDPMLLVATVALLLASAFVDSVSLRTEASPTSSQRTASEHAAGRVSVSEERYPSAPLAPQPQLPPSATFTFTNE